MKKTWLSLSLMSILLAAGCSAAKETNGQTSPSPTPTSPPVAITTAQEAETIFLQKTDLDGDGKLETISLLSSDKRENQHLPYAKQTIRIEKEGSKQDIEVKNEPMGTPIDLSVTDLTGDGKKELAYRMNLGGTGKGIVKLFLYTLDANGNYQEMAVKTKHDPDFRLKLLDNRDYELSDPELNKVWTLKMDEEKIKQTGNPNMSGDKLTIDPPYEWNWTDIDQDGKTELLSKRAVWVKSHPNMLFAMQTVYKWDGQAFVSQSYTIHTEPGVQVVN